MRGKSTPEAAVRTQIEQLFSTTKLTPEEKIDQLLPLLNLTPATARNLPAVRSNLKPIFQDAQEDGIDLLHPPEDFHAWLLDGPLSRIGAERGVARSNTINARASALSRLYLRLEDQGVIQVHPLRRLKLPRKEEDVSELPDAAEIGTLLNGTARSSGEEAVVHAALHLIYELAFTVTDLLTLTWEQIDVPQRRLLRRSESQFSDALALALQRIRQAPGPLLATAAAQRQRVIDLSEREFRLRYWKAFKHAEVTYVPPARLRLAGLRDHPRSGSLLQQAQQAGYQDPKAYRKALEQAQKVAQSLTGPPAVKARKRPPE